MLLFIVIVCTNRKEWNSCSSGIGSCEYVLMIARSHMVLTTPSGQKIKTSPTDWHNDQCVFDYQEDQFFFQVVLYCAYITNGCCGNDVIMHDVKLGSDLLCLCV